MIQPVLKKLELVKVPFEIENVIYYVDLSVEIYPDGEMSWTIFDIDTEHRKLLDALLTLHYDYEITDLINEELEKKHK